MGFWGRVWQGMTGQAKKRIPKQMELLGASTEFVEKARSASEETQEALFLKFTNGRHACALDWRATSDDVLEGLLPLLSDAEKTLLPSAEALPEDAAGAIAEIRSMMARGPRTVIQTNTLGDFSILILVPQDKADEFNQCVGPWLIP